MTIVLAYADTPPGHAALHHAAKLARLLDEPVLLVTAEHAHEASADRARELLGQDAAELRIDVAESGLHDPSDRVIQVAQEADASYIVLGLRHRSAVGKLLLGSTAQRILLDATCPVVGVKADGVR